MTRDQARGLLLSLLPLGYDHWFDLAPGPDPGNPRLGASHGWLILDGAAEQLALRVFTPAEQLLLDGNPATLTAVGIASWELALDLSTTRAAQYGPDSARLAQVIARLRESGASTLANIAAALRALTGPAAGALTIIEMSRAALTAANRVDMIPGGATVPGSSTVSFSVVLGDNAVASQAGAQLTINAASMGTPANCTATLTGASGDVLTIPNFVSLLQGVPVRVYWPAYAGKAITGTWTLTIVNGDADGVVFGDAEWLFVEGIGRDATTGAEGKAASIFEWTALIDESLITPSTYDRALARAIVQRWNPAHCRGYLTIKASHSIASGIWSGDPGSGLETNSDWDGFIWA